MCSIVNCTEPFVDTVNKYNLDLVALTETCMLKANDNVIDVIQSPRTTGKGGGVALVFRKSFKVHTQDIHYKSMETMGITLYCDSLTYVIVVYRPPSVSEKNNSFNVFLKVSNDLLWSYMHGEWKAAHSWRF